MKVSVIHSAFGHRPETVASIDAGERDIEAALEYAYMRTQNIQGSWSRPNNPDWSEDVTVLAPLPISKRTGALMGLRSTSVGDIMVIDGERFKVDYIGFESLDEACV